MTADQGRRAEAAAAEAAGILLGIRRSRDRPAGLPSAVAPRTVEEAYAIQDAVVAGLGGIGGWKIVHPPPGVAPRCSPIPAAEIRDSGCGLDWDAMLWPEVEVEIAVILGADLPPRTRPYEAAEMRQAIGRVTGAFELLGSRFADRRTAPRLDSLADLLSSAGVVTGRGAAPFDAIEMAGVAMSLRFDGVEVGTAAGGPSSAEVLGTLTWLANHAAARAGGLRAGQVVITGARIHPLDLPQRGAQVAASVAGLGEVEMTLRGAADGRTA
jgi:2-keto-4-pentenoate hydratase